MRVLYSETINVDKDVHLECLQWMQKVHIPQMLATGLFEENRILRLVNEEQNTGVTYSLQFVLKNRSDLAEYQNVYETQFRSALYNKYTNKLVDFVTILELIE
ncbi:MAG TPA: DUF4286 family protein [Cytophagaceae bacterium]